jgi:hypothetical protein
MTSFNYAHLPGVGTVVEPGVEDYRTSFQLLVLEAASGVSTRWRPIPGVDRRTAAWRALEGERWARLIRMRRWMDDHSEAINLTMPKVVRP